MLAQALWQALLNGFGFVLAWIYSVVPNYGIAIVLMTVAIRLVLLPLGIKQIKSMQNMQALQPKVKELQKKYKNNKEKLQQEQMRLYREAGVNPLGGCLPMLLTLPFLFAMYAVIKQPILSPSQQQKGAFVVENNHLPEDSQLFQNVLLHKDTDFLFMNLQCNLVGSGTQVELRYKDPSDGKVKQLPNGAPILGTNGQPLSFPATTQSTLDCGASRIPYTIPYVLLVAIMVGSTYFQTFQMQRASPAGSSTSQQQAITRVMPLMFAFFGLQFPAGLVLYWTTSNGLQVAQQTYLLRAGHIGPEALDRRMAEQRARMENQEPKKGIMGWITERAEAAQKQRQDPTGNSGSTNRNQPNRGSAKGGPPQKGQRPPQKPKPGSKQPGSNAKGQSGASKDGAGAAPKKPRRPSSGGAPPGNQLKRDQPRTPDPEETP
ncbi:MAG TPA: membrane protein insertase YidC [Actinomycetota bacterium]|nr:membrane protein insertase YidC [Actinomycetota bacterium]